MRAIEYNRYGPPDVLRLSDVPRPVPGVDEVLIKVHATTVNRTDCGFLRARPAIVRLVSGLTKPRRTILGNEFAGEIEAVGRGVTSFGIGDRVFGYCEGIFGAHAEYMTVPASGSLATLPAGLSYQQAAPATEGAHYALGYLRNAKVGAGSRLLVNGATGAIGSAAVQLAKHYGAHVTAVCGTVHLALWTAAFGSRRVLFPIPKHSKEDVVFLKELIEQGRFRPLIDRCYPLEQVPDAFRYVETGQKVGSVVITVTRDGQDEGTA